MSGNVYISEHGPCHMGRKLNKWLRNFSIIHKRAYDDVSTERPGKGSFILNFFEKGIQAFNFSSFLKYKVRSHLIMVSHVL